MNFVSYPADGFSPFARITTSPPCCVAVNVAVGTISHPSGNPGPAGRSVGRLVAAVVACVAGRVAPARTSLFDRPFIPASSDECPELPHPSIIIPNTAAHAHLAHMRTSFSLASDQLKGILRPPAQDDQRALRLIIPRHLNLPRRPADDPG
jgi:hypothetical protein